MNTIIKEFYNINKSIFDTLTCDDFTNYYFSIITKKDFFKVCNRFYDLCIENGVKITQMESYYFCILRVIDDTWHGFQREIRILKNIEEWYPNAIVKFSAENDIDYCIDIEVYYDDVLFDVFQVKPYSFLSGLQNNKEYCINAYRDNFKKHKEFYELNNIYPYYIIEHDQELIVTRYDELSY